MTVSVVIAAYKGEKFIGGQLESLAKQHRIPDEVVICDDSPDVSTWDVVKDFTDKLDIRYFRNETQYGVNRNFEKAVSLASGDIIFLCDQDDVWHPEKIAVMEKSLLAVPEADGVFCNSTVTDEHLDPLGFSLWQMRDFTSAMQRQVKNGDVLKVFLKRVTLSAHNVAFRRKILENILPYPELSPFYSDTWIGLYVALTSNWVMVDRELTSYRVHGDNLSAPELAGIAAQAKLSLKARKMDSLARRVDIADALKKALPDDIEQYKLIMLSGFRRHYASRSGYSSNFLLRLWQIFCEVLSLRYFRYSNGWKSIAADLFLFR